METPGAYPLLAHWLKSSPLHSSPVLVSYSPAMAEKLDPNEIVTLEELAISSMWEMAAPVIDLP